MSTPEIPTPPRGNRKRALGAVAAAVVIAGIAYGTQMMQQNNLRMQQNNREMLDMQRQRQQPGFPR